MFPRVWVRLVSSLLLAPLLLLSVTHSAWTCSVLLLTMALATMREFYDLTKKFAVFPQKWWGMGTFCIVHSVVFAHLHCRVCWSWLYIIPAVVSTVYPLELYAKRRFPFANIAYSLVGLLYVGGGFLFLSVAAFSPAGVYNFEVIVGALLLTWANDTGAYLCGSAFGKRKLLERVSPNKSWEGAFGGAVFAACTGHLLSYRFTTFTQTYWIGMSVVTFLCGTYGDLVASMFKRSIGVKDSGDVIPGHGGLLDRFDSLLLASPWILFLTKLMQ